MRLTVVFALFMFACPFAATAQLSYDRFAVARPLPSPPFRPTTDVECVRYREQAERIVGYVGGEHEKCLKSENKDSKQVAFVQDPSDRCSVPACQALHDARTGKRAEANKLVAQCQADLAAHKQKVAAEQRAREEAQATGAKTDPCSKRWLQYEMICAGGSATRSDQQTCQRELNDLRAKCPSR